MKKYANRTILLWLCFLVGVMLLIVAASLGYSSHILAEQNIQTTQDSNK